MANYVDVARLVASGVHPTQARLFAEPLSRACDEFDITTRERIAMFVAQLVHESTGFTRLEEDLYYKTPERIRAIFPSSVPSLEIARTLVRNPKALANLVYADKNGNGPESSGHGWLYRGRGLIQTTGLANYRAAARIIGVPLIERPDLLLVPEHASRAAGGYWAQNNCNRLADLGDVDGITRAINGPKMVAAKERRELTQDAMEAFA